MASTMEEFADALRKAIAACPPGRAFVFQTPLNLANMLNNDPPGVVKLSHVLRGGPYDGVRDKWSNPGKWISHDDRGHYLNTGEVDEYGATIFEYRNEPPPIADAAKPPETWRDRPSLF